MAAAATINEVRELIIAGKYPAARQLLKTASHPKTDEWLLKLNQLEQVKTQPRQRQLAPVEKTQTHLVPAAAKTQARPVPAAAKTQARTSQQETREMKAVARRMSASQITTLQLALSRVRYADPKKDVSPVETLYNDKTFTITREQITIEEAVYPLRQIDAVEVQETVPPDQSMQAMLKGGLSLALCVVAAVLFYDKLHSQVVALFAAVGAFSSIGWLIWKLLPDQAPRTYTLRFRFGMVDEAVYVTHDRAYINEIEALLKLTLAQCNRSFRKLVRPS